MSKRTTRTSVTLNTTLTEITDSLLTPSGFFGVPKGSYSTLFNILLTKHLEEVFKADILEIASAFRDCKGDIDAVWIKLAQL